MKNMFFEAKARSRGSINNFNEEMKKDQFKNTNEYELFKEKITKKNIKRFIGNCYPQRDNFINWLLKVLGLLFFVTMTSKIYLLYYFPIKEIGFSSSLVMVNETHLNETQGKITIFNKSQTHKIWKQPIQDRYYRCSQRTKKEIRTNNATDGYILITANGGLNQMRAGISDMVAIAHLMNATLVRPKLDHNSYWQDKSEFSDIYDWKKFTQVLKDDINVVEYIPPEFERRKFLVKAPISWSKANYYKWEMSKLLRKYKVIHFSQTDSRLSNNGLSGSIQRLRCRAMFESLEYTHEINSLANNFISILRRNNTPYVALHLRYEKDMLAFTACTHNLTLNEAQELTKMRRRTRHWKEKRINGEKKRQQGACPMTPREVAVFLEALGFPSDTIIYIVAGDIYGQKGLEPLRAKYPNVYDHKTLSIEEEVAPFLGHSNKLAAVDHMVALDSDIFIYTYDGHMAKAVKGHRLYKGFQKTISPDIKNFVKLIDLLDNKQISWKDFSWKVKELHKGRDGSPTYRQVGPTPRLEESFYANPYPGCICDKRN